MPLDTKQKEFFDTLFGERYTEIMARTATDFQKGGYIDSSQAPRFYADISEQFAKDIAEARIDAYIETVETLGIVPQKEDFHPLGLEIKESSLKVLNTFHAKMKQPFINQDEAWQSKMSTVLAAKIEQIVGHAVPRLKYFIDKRSLLDEMKPPPSRSPAKTPWSRDQKLSLTQVLLGIAAIVLAAIAIFAGLATAEGRSFICRNVGYLCVQPSQDATR